MLSVVTAEKALEMLEGVFSPMKKVKRKPLRMLCPGCL